MRPRGRECGAGMPSRERHHGTLSPERGVGYCRLQLKTRVRTPLKGSAPMLDGNDHPVGLPSQAQSEPSEEEVQAQLERLLASPDFDVRARARKFLRYIVEETLAGRSDRIKAYSIGIEVFERDP